MDPELVTREALALPAPERARLAELLLSSLDDLPEQEVERVWVTEAQRRAAEIDAGELPPVTADELRQRVRMTCSAFSRRSFLEDGGLGLLIVLLELRRGAVAQAAMRTDLVVVLAPALDDGGGLAP